MDLNMPHRILNSLPSALTQQTFPLSEEKKPNHRDGASDISGGIGRWPATDGPALAMMAVPKPSCVLIARSSQPDDRKIAVLTSIPWIAAAQTENIRALLILDNDLRTQDQDAVVISYQIHQALAATYQNVYLHHYKDLHAEKRAIDAVLAKGGAIVVNLAGFTEGQTLESLNGLFADRPEFEGVFAAEDADVRIVALLSKAEIEADRFSDAFLSRFLDPYDIEKDVLGMLPLSKSLARSGKLTEPVIDLMGSASWRKILHHELSKVKFKCADKKIFLKHPPSPPEEKLFLAYLHKQQLLYGFEFVLYQRRDSKTSADPKWISSYTHESRSPILVIHRGNFDRIFVANYAVDAKKIASKPPLIAELSRSYRLRLREDLTPAQVGAVFDYVSNQKPNFTLEVTPEQAALLGCDVAASIDPEQEAQEIPDDAEFLDIGSRLICAGDLIERFVCEDKGMRIEEGDLLKTLQAGKTWVLRGVSKRPDLQLIENLICERPHVIFDGKIVSDFKGKILVEATRSDDASVPGVIQADEKTDFSALFNQHRALFFLGPHSSGKLFRVKALLHDMKGELFHPGPIGNRHHETFVAGLKTWASARPKGKGPIVLVVKGADLAEKNFWDVMRTVFETPPKLLGQALTEQHKIIFTGNGCHLPGRQRQTVIEQYFQTVEFTPITNLKQQIVVPDLKELGLDAKLAKPLLDFHQFFKKRFPAEPATIRSLKNVMLRLAASKEPKGLANLLRLACIVYAGGLSLVQQRALRSFIQERWEVEISEPKPHAKILKDTKEGFSALPSAEQLAQDIVEELAFCAHDFADCSVASERHRAWVIEGPPGRGKDITIEQTLQYLHYEKLTADDVATHAKQYYCVTAGLGFAALSKIVKQASRTKALVVISELNLLPPEILEGFNDLLMESDVQIIATINSPKLSGRQPLSAGLRDHLRYLSIPDYTEPEQVQLLRTDGLDERNAKAIVAKHKEITVRQRARGAKARLPTTRQLRAAAAQYKKTNAVEQAIKRAYRYYLLTAAMGVSKDREIDSQSEYALAFARLLWPKSPFTSVEWTHHILNLLPHTLTLVREQPTTIMHAQIIAAVAVAKYGQQYCKGTLAKRALSCCQQLDQDLQFKQACHLRADVTKYAERFLKQEASPKLLAPHDSRPSLLGGLQKKYQSYKLAQALSTPPSQINEHLSLKPITQIQSGLFKRESVRRYGKWSSIKHLSLPNLYLASSYFSPRTTKPLAGGRERWLNLALKHCKEGPKCLPTATVIVDLALLENGIPEIPVITGHAPWVGVNGSKSWGIPPDCKNARTLRFDLIPVEDKDDVPQPDDDKCIERLRIPMSAIQDQKLAKLIESYNHEQAEFYLDELVAWIQTHIRYAFTNDEKLAALEAYDSGGEPPALVDVLRVRYGDCVLGNSLFASFVDQYFKLPVRLVCGWLGKSDKKISTVAHCWTEVFLQKRWQTYDATPSVLAVERSEYEPRPYFSTAHARIIERVAEITRGDEWHAGTLTLVSSPSIAPSRQTTGVVFESDGVPRFEEIDVDIRPQKKAIVFVASKDVSFYGDLLSEANRDMIVAALLEIGFKLHVVDGEAMHSIASVADLWRWAKSAPAEAAQATLDNRNTMVLTLTALFEHFDMLVERDPFDFFEYVSPKELQDCKWFRFENSNALGLSEATLTKRCDLIPTLIEMGHSASSIDIFGYSEEDYRDLRTVDFAKRDKGGRKYIVAHFILESSAWEEILHWLPTCEDLHRLFELPYHGFYKVFSRDLRDDQQDRLLTWLEVLNQKNLFDRKILQCCIGHRKLTAELMMQFLELFPDRICVLVGDWLRKDLLEYQDVYGPRHPYLKEIVDALQMHPAFVALKAKFEKYPFRKP
jgi:hypothetical protein